MIKVGYQGVHGAYSEVAVLQMFEGKEAEAVGYSEFSDIFRALENDEIDYGVFPVENTTTGLISRTYDLFKDHDIHIIGETVVPVRHNLIGLPGTDKKDIRKVYSHPEALSQCRRFFQNNKEMVPVVYEDTALSVRMVKETGDATKAALASERAAEFYQMEILERNVMDNDANMTRFLCVSMHEEPDVQGNKVSIMMVLKHAPGALYHALGIFASLNINVLKLESRPIQGKLFEYSFYLDFAGNLHDKDVEEAIRRLRYDTLYLKVFGCYRADELCL